MQSHQRKEVQGRAPFGSASVAALLILCAGTSCGNDGKSIPEPAAGDKGDLEVAVVDSAGKKPLAKVSLITDPATSSAITDESGKFVFKEIPAGSYKVVATLKGFDTSTSPVVGVARGLTTKMTIEMVRGKGTAPVVSTGADQLQAGYGKSFTVTATAADPDDAGKLTYQWTQTSGPKVTVAGDATPTLSFTALTLKEAFGGTLPSRFGVLGINPDQSATYKFKVTVTDPSGNKAEATATVASASPTTGLGNVPIGLRVYLNGGEAAAYSWSLTAKPVGSAATLSDEQTRNPSFLPDKEGRYVVSEATSNKSVEIYAGVFAGVEGKETLCTGCHNGTIAPDVFKDWANTKHAKKFAFEIDGGADPSTSKYSESCLACHTVGYDKSADNGGFDDVAKSAGWKFPSKLEKGNWDAMSKNYPAVAQLANIQCESCHGPQTSGGHTKSVRVSYSAEVCGTCHASGSHHYKPGLLAKSKHANLELAAEEATFEKRGTTAAHCGRCHSAQGFGLYVRQLAKGTDPSKSLLKSDGSAADEAFLRKLGLEAATVQPITCVACHDPHSGAKPGQLRVFDNQNLAAGFSVKGAGAGALCMTCHNTRNGARGDSVGEPANYGAPHVAAQTDVFYGRNAYYVSGINVSKHTAVADTCVGCHVKAPASFLTKDQSSNHTFKADNGICKACHSSSVDGEALQSVIEGELAGLSDKLGKALLAKINAQPTVAVRAWDEASDSYSSTAPSGQTPVSNVMITAKPTQMESVEIHGQQGFAITLPAPVSFTVDDGKGNKKSITTDVVKFQLGSLTLPDGKTQLLQKSDPIVKAGWNYYLLHSDGSKGLHNPSFYLKVIDASKAALPQL